MKTNFTQLALVAALSLTGATAVLADNLSYDASPDLQQLRWFRQVQESKIQPTANQLAPYGYATSGTAARVVNIDGGTKHLNVTRLESVRIIVGGKSVTWMFDTLGTSSFPLSKVIPGADGVTVYVTENPSYSGG
ncbi:conserved exported hypothetical protein [Candidatus Propionivibrio aalborgensis]|uniref:CzcE family metal-binding protein n=1 Tax=Candidatus Propionivibrio aalborgensis TaxID=1860101 RepID=A0A1A8Y221_9RHOO|nr:CzcE family metal-binding protein [Candidatus Propionivibrio aalborgensis]SBT10423.1 conserved exported hypothetical protein [Candidatus Propionivibrio aalborgensis]